MTTTPSRLPLVLRVKRLKWIHSRSVVLEGTSTDKPVEKTCNLALATAGKSCLVTVCASPRNKKRQRSNGESDKSQQTATDCLTSLRQAADQLQLPALASSREIANETGPWIPTNCDLLLAVECLPTNRKGARLVTCDRFVKLWYEEKESVQTDNATTNTLDNNHQRKVKNQTQSTTSLSFGLHHKFHRHELFADWIIETYGHQQAILDVAGGNGALARALLVRGIPKIVLLDPQPRLTTVAPELQEEQDKLDRNITIIAKPLVGDGSNLLNCPIAGPLLRQCTLMVGMHPDQATEAMMDLSQRLDN